MRQVWEVGGSEESKLRTIVLEEITLQFLGGRPEG